MPGSMIAVEKHEVLGSAVSGASESFQLARVLTLAGAHSIHDTYQSFLPPLLPEFIARLALTKTEAGLLTVFLRAPSLLQPFIGYLADRVNLRYAVVLGPVLTAMMMSLLGVAPGYAMLALFLVIAGTSSACLHAVGPVMAGHLSGQHLGQGMGFWMVGGELGRVLGPLVIAIVLSTLGLAGLPWLMLGGLAASALLYLLLRTVPDRPRQMEDVLPWRDALHVMAPFLLLIAGLVVTRAFLLEAMSTYLAVFLREEGVDLWLTNVALSVFQGAGVVGAFFIGMLSDRLGRKRILFLFMLAAPFLMLAFLSVQGWTLILVLPVLGFALISLTPVIMALVQERYPENRSLANGIYMGLSFVLRSGVTVVVGALGDAFGLRTAFMISAVMPLVGLLVIRRLPSQ